MEEKNKIEAAVSWYGEHFTLYQGLASYVESIVRVALKEKNIIFHTITSRPKGLAEYKDKASKAKYKDPKNEIMDMAGIRVITYLDSDAKKAAEIIKSLFQYFPEHSKDKSEELGTDKVGYRSIHCVCSLGDNQCQADREPFKGLYFEIQVRTILQHAWAEFEHDRNYKFKEDAVLPDHIKRRLKLVAGDLELLDWTFELIASSISEYVDTIHKKTSEGNLLLKITTVSLNIFLRQKFNYLAKLGFQLTISNDSEIISELSIMGINKLKELDEIIPKDYEAKSLEFKCFENVVGNLRNIMIIYNAKEYFEKAWREAWYDLTPECITLLREYGVKIEDYIEKCHLDVVPSTAEEPEYAENEPEYEPDYEEPPYEEPEYDVDCEEEPPDMEPPEEEPPDCALEEYEPPEEEPPYEEPPEVEPDYEQEEEEPPEEEPPDIEPEDDEPQENEEPDNYEP